jgi:superfamily II DNA or RNA helicase
MVRGTKKRRSSTSRTERTAAKRGRRTAPRKAPRTATRTAPRTARLTLKDYLSRLTFLEAVKYLGKGGAALLRAGAAFEIDVGQQVRLTPQRLEVRLHNGARVCITLREDARRRLHYECSHCNLPCAHAGAAFSLVLEHKMSLGLSALPPQDLPSELLTEEQLIARAYDERRQRAAEERMRIQSQDPAEPWTDYVLTSGESGRTYRVALRGSEPGQSYCSCPDFRTNTLGTCKHILHTLKKVERKFTNRALRKPFRRRELEVYLEYGAQIGVRVGIPDDAPPAAHSALGRWRDAPVDQLPLLLKALRKLDSHSIPVTVFPDAQEYIETQLLFARLKQLGDELRTAPERHPLRKSLLRGELLPYQLDGVGFAVAAGRAILADDMGLGKTMQGIGVAEVLAREAGIRRVLVVCPASLKSQWRNEIERFSDRPCQLILGSADERVAQYQNDCFFTICNYEQVVRDIVTIEREPWDLIVLDEAQRIKNWAAKTSRTIKGLQSRFALVLTGTPLENRLDELYSVVQFIDDRRLGPAFRFYHRHRIVDENGKVLGYRNLDELRERLRGVLLRRTRGSVLQQLPERVTEVVRITPTAEQKAMHDGYIQVVATIIRKKFLTEMDLLRLQQALLMARLSANSSFLVDKHPPGYSSKLERCGELLEQLLDEADRKIVIFSEWKRMLDLIQPLLEKHPAEYVRLDGDVPQKERQKLVHRFQTDSQCRAFLATNAGATGLNLQAANTVINVDLPWNPAVLEQRIARAHRMGQKRNVHVYVLVSEDTIEDNLLNTLSSKKKLASAAIDLDSTETEVGMQSGAEELRRRLEVLLGKTPEAAPDVSQQQQREQEAAALGRRTRVAEAGGELLGAAIRLLGELVGHDQPPPPGDVTRDLTHRLEECLVTREDGCAQLTLTLPDASAVQSLAQALAKLLVAGQSSQVAAARVAAR